MKLLEKALKLTDTALVRYGGIGAAAALIIAGAYLALVWSPEAMGETAVYRIVYFHVPTAIMAYLGFFVTFAGSFLFLWKKEMLFDRVAKVGAELGVLFCGLMLITGMIWGKQRWGAWWIWEPRLTTALILLIIYAGYLILRSTIDNQMTRARYAAVFGIVGFLDVPVVHFAIKMWGSIMHPVVIKSMAEPGMPPEMLNTLRVCLLAFGALFAALFLLRLRVENLAAEIAALRSNHED
ncbi:MAG: cytochrome c biogenesis protein CcsA [Nitrospinae bacterium]|nr:cytochrome c biogenesis protein CcsA [Nitrospinota bacterium]